MKIAIFVSIFLFLIFTIHAQTITWSKVFGSPDSVEIAHTIKQTQDGGYIIIGLKALSPNWNIWILRLDENGVSMWTREYINIGGTQRLDIEFGFDSGYVFYGSIANNINDTAALVVIWTNSIGDSIKSQIYYIGINNYILNFPTDIDQTHDSCFIITGSWVYGNEESFIIKINNNGDSLWATLFGAEERCSSVIETVEGSFLASINGQPPYQRTIDKFDSLGQRIEGLCSLGCHVADIEKMIDSDYVYVSYDNGQYSIVKITEDLDTIWTRPGIGYNDVAPCSDGGFVVTGSYNNDLFLTKFNTDGDSLWTVTYGGGGSDIGRCVEQTQDGGFIICGSTTSYGTGSSDFYIIKTDSLGYALGVEEEPDPVLYDNDDIVVENISLGSIRISFVSPQTDDLVLRLYDLSGREIESSYRVQTENNRTSIVVRNLNPGVYFFRIEGERKLHEGKFVIL